MPREKTKSRPPKIDPPEKLTIRLPPNVSEKLVRDAIARAGVVGQVHTPTALATVLLTRAIAAYDPRVG